MDLYIKHHSRIASNRTTFDRTNNSVEVPVRYLDNSKIELYKNYPYKNSIHKSTFFKYICREFEDFNIPENFGINSSLICNFFGDFLFFIVVLKIKSYNTFFKLS